MTVDRETGEILDEPVAAERSPVDHRAHRAYWLERAREHLREAGVTTGTTTQGEDEDATS